MLRGTQKCVDIAAQPTALILSHAINAAHLYLLIYRVFAPSASEGTHQMRCFARRAAPDWWKGRRTMILGEYLH